MNSVQREMRERVQNHIDTMRSAGLDLNECGDAWRKPEVADGRMHKYREFGIGYLVGDAQVDDWFPLIESGLVDLDVDSRYVYVATWLLR